MAHVAINGGEEAILKSQTLLAEQRRGDVAVPEITLAQIASQFGLAVDRVMSEGSLYDRDLAALALKQAQGDALEAIFLLRAYRTTLPRIAASEPIDTSKMNVRRRVSATFKDVPGGQVLGATYDYTHRLLDFALSETADGAPRADVASEPLYARMPSALDPLLGEGLIEEDVRSDAEAYDLTREPLCLPAGRDQRLQNLARGDEGFLLGLAYSSARGYGSVHPFVGELRAGEVTIQITPEELGFPIDIADIGVTECQMINQLHAAPDDLPRFTRGYGLAFGHCERKTIAMALVDRAMRAAELGEKVEHPAQDEEFVLSHSDNVEASGFVSHFKLPHYVDFQAETRLLRELRAHARSAAEGEPGS